ncbi:MAG: oxygenase MpaB family protein [Dehalococcoidia bacterium]
MNRPDGTATRWPDAFLDQQRRIGDPEADETIAALHAGGETGTVFRLLQTIVRNETPPPEELPDSVHRYFDAARDLPDWADRELILRGQHVFQRWGMQIGLLLFHKAMAEGYLAARFARVLGRTGALAHDPRRRLLETGQLVFDAMAPGGLGIGGKGIATALRVRLLHAAIRHTILAQAEREPATWTEADGAPISQEDMAFTLLGFSLVTLDGLAQLGARISREDPEAYIHCWRVVGHFVGIDEAMNPATLSEARELLNAQRRRQYSITEQGLGLEHAMLAMLTEMSPGPMRHFPTQMVRYLIGREYAAQLQVPRAPLTARLGFGAYIRANRAALWFVSVTRIANVSEPFNRAILHRMIGSGRGGERAPFTVDPALRQKWRL